MLCLLSELSLFVGLDAPLRFHGNNATLPHLIKYNSIELFNFRYLIA